MDSEALLRLLNGDCGISPAMAIALERIDWSNAKFWMRRQADYDLASERHRQSEPVPKALRNFGFQMQLAGFEKSGIIYVLTNPSMSNLVKIGRTSDLPARLKQLYSTGVPNRFKCIYAVEVDDAPSMENGIHRSLEPYRVNQDREFFKIDPKEVIKLLNLIKIKEVTPDN